MTTNEQDRAGQAQAKPENMKWLLDAANQVISELRRQEQLDSDTFRWLCNSVGQVERDLKRPALAAAGVTIEPSALRELRELSEKATAGPLDVETVSDAVRITVGKGRQKWIMARLATKQIPEAETHANAKFWVACVNYVRAALSAEQPKSASGGQP